MIDVEQRDLLKCKNVLDFSQRKKLKTFQKKDFYELQNKILVNM
jgi:hypothetical protein